jgi:hypothetical protein
MLHLLRLRRRPLLLRKPPRKRRSNLSLWSKKKPAFRAGFFVCARGAVRR